VNEPPSVAVLGEVLWDVFAQTRRLGGAPLNFAAHMRRLGHPVSLISAVGDDELGREAAQLVAALDLDTRLLQTTSGFATGTATVRIGAGGSAEFAIPRPAAYDALDFTAAQLQALAGRGVEWFYYGTLFAATVQGRQVLDRVLDALRGALKFYDLNLRPGAESPALVEALLAHADVIKLNEHELARVSKFTGLPADVESFCYAASERYDLHAVSITLGERGCAILTRGEFVAARAYPVVVADTVGAGDSFAAAFLHGLCRQWPVREVADFANRIAADVAARHGSLPDGTEETHDRLSHDI
jgi:fructokinase